MKSAASSILLLALAWLPTRASAFSSEFLTIDHTPYDAGQFSINVAIAPQLDDCVRFTVTIHPKHGTPAHRWRTDLAKLEMTKSSFSAVPARKLTIKKQGDDTVIVFDTSAPERKKLSFELMDFGEVTSRPMPSMTDYVFSLHKPPTARQSVKH